MRDKLINPSFDIQRARRDTRGCADIVHFNNAGAALMPSPVADALHAYLNKEEHCGTGLLYVSRELIELLEPPMLDQHAATLLSASEYRIRSDARRFENWEQHLAGKAALGTAIDYALSYGMESIRTRIYQLADSLRSQLSKMDGVAVWDEGVAKCGIVTFTTAQMSPGDIKRRFGKYRINVSTSKGSGSLVSFQHRGLTEIVRASLHYYNSEDEIGFFIDALSTILLLNF